jgi:hypothetical protein
VSIKSDSEADRSIHFVLDHNSNDNEARRVSSAAIPDCVTLGSILTVARLRELQSEIPPVANGLPPPYTPTTMPNGQFYTPATTEYAASHPPSPPRLPLTETSSEQSQSQSLVLTPTWTHDKAPPKPKVSHSTIDPKSTSIASNIGHSSLESSHIHSSTISNSKIVASFVNGVSSTKHSKVKMSKIEDGSEISNSTIEGSTVRGAKLTHCTVRNSIVEGGEYNGMKIVDQRVRDHDFLGLDSMNE